MTFYLGSRESYEWSGARACRVLRPAEGISSDTAVWVGLDPSGPGGESAVIIAPRYRGDTIPEDVTSPVVVNIIKADTATGGSISPERARVVAIGEIYATKTEAATTVYGRRQG